MVHVDDKFILVQHVKPADNYKLQQDGSISAYCRRTMALEKLLGHPIKSRIKIKFVVTKIPLPGIPNPSKSSSYGGMPIDYMYPVDLLKDVSEIDFDWYKKRGIG